MFSESLYHRLSVLLGRQLLIKVCTRGLRVCVCLHVYLVNLNICVCVFVCVNGLLKLPAFNTLNCIAAIRKPALSNNTLFSPFSFFSLSRRRLFIHTWWFHWSIDFCCLINLYWKCHWFDVKQKVFEKLSHVVNRNIKSITEQINIFNTNAEWILCQKTEAAACFC